MFFHCGLVYWPGTYPSRKGSLGHTLDKAVWACTQQSQMLIYPSLLSYYLLAKSMRVCPSKRCSFLLGFSLSNERYISLHATRTVAPRMSVPCKLFEALSIGHEHTHLKGALLGYAEALEAIIIVGCIGLHATNRLAYLSVP